ncbi:hypothetical protein CYMTET_15267 [Cymbomonas tetramitiformis]|uniref:Cadherin-like beta-sandwich-like domain-containing protein n=1 Tax=Cymbomonas tetramitiformis TaxID=36881 RepID=A0AAE0GEQ6_9CHLO|nr:hypothetical protein CYMTET_15267 [Cymbomonas tetramitiformis]
MSNNLRSRWKEPKAELKVLQRGLVGCRLRFSLLSLTIFAGLPIQIEAPAGGFDPVAQEAPELPTLIGPAPQEPVISQEHTRRLLVAGESVEETAELTAEGFGGALWGLDHLHGIEPPVARASNSTLKVPARGTLPTYYGDIVDSWYGDTWNTIYQALPYTWQFAEAQFYDFYPGFYHNVKVSDKGADGWALSTRRVCIVGSSPAIGPEEGGTRVTLHLAGQLSPRLAPRVGCQFGSRVTPVVSVETGSDGTATVECLSPPWRPDQPHTVAVRLTLDGREFTHDGAPFHYHSPFHLNKDSAFAARVSSHDWDGFRLVLPLQPARSNAYLFPPFLYSIVGEATLTAACLYGDVWLEGEVSLQEEQVECHVPLHGLSEELQLARVSLNGQVTSHDGIWFQLSDGRSTLKAIRHERHQLPPAATAPPFHVDYLPFSPDLCLLLSAPHTSALAALELSAGELYPPFDPKVYEYSVVLRGEELPEDFSVELTPRTSDWSATVQVAGVPVRAGENIRRQLSVGENHIAVEVAATGERGERRKHLYDLKMYILAESLSKGSLAHLRPSTGLIEPPFDADSRGPYSVVVEPSTTEISLEVASLFSLPVSVCLGEPEGLPQCERGINGGWSRAVKLAEGLNLLTVFAGEEADPSYELLVFKPGGEQGSKAAAGAPAVASAHSEEHVRVDLHRPRRSRGLIDGLDIPWPTLPSPSRPRAPSMRPPRTIFTRRGWTGSAAPHNASFNHSPAPTSIPYPPPSLPLHRGCPSTSSHAPTPRAPQVPIWSQLPAGWSTWPSPPPSRSASQSVPLAAPLPPEAPPTFDCCPAPLPPNDPPPPPMIPYLLAAPLGPLQSPPRPILEPPPVASSQRQGTPPICVAWVAPSPLSAPMRTPASVPSSPPAFSVAPTMLATPALPTLVLPRPTPPPPPSTSPPTLPAAPKTPVEQSAAPLAGLAWPVVPLLHAGWSQVGVGTMLAAPMGVTGTPQSSEKGRVPGDEMEKSTLSAEPLGEPWLAAGSWQLPRTHVAVPAGWGRWPDAPIAMSQYSKKDSERSWTDSTFDSVEGGVRDSGESMDELLSEDGDVVSTKLSVLELSIGELRPAFHPDMHVYYTILDEREGAAFAVGLRARPAERRAVVRVDGDTLAGGHFSRRRLSPGTNTLEVQVTSSQLQNVSSTYTVQVYVLTEHLPAGSLTEIAASAGRLEPEFSALFPGPYLLHLPDPRAQGPSAPPAPGVTLSATSLSQAPVRVCGGKEALVGECEVLASGASSSGIRLQDGVHQLELQVLDTNLSYKVILQDPWQTELPDRSAIANQVKPTSHSPPAPRMYAAPAPRWYRPATPRVPAPSVVVVPEPPAEGLAWKQRTWAPVPSMPKPACSGALCAASDAARAHPRLPPRAVNPMGISRNRQSRRSMPLPPPSTPPPPMAVPPPPPPYHLLLVEASATNAFPAPSDPVSASSTPSSAPSSAPSDPMSAISAPSDPVSAILAPSDPVSSILAPSDPAYDPAGVHVTASHDGSDPAGALELSVSTGGFGVALDSIPGISPHLAVDPEGTDSGTSDASYMQHTQIPPDSAAPSASDMTRASEASTPTQQGALAKQLKPGQPDTEAHHWWRAEAAEAGQPDTEAHHWRRHGGSPLVEVAEAAEAGAAGHGGSLLVEAEAAEAGQSDTEAHYWWMWQQQLKPGQSDTEAHHWRRWQKQLKPGQPDMEAHYWWRGQKQLKPGQSDTEAH